MEVFETFIYTFGHIQVQVGSDVLSLAGLEEAWEEEEEEEEEEECELGRWARTITLVH